MDRTGSPVGTPPLPPPEPPSVGAVVGAGIISSPRPAAAPAAAPKPVRRRNRMIHSCLPCRQRKIRCSKTTPSCANCAKAARECLYLGPRLDEAGQMRLAEIKEKQGTLERQLERDVARPSAAAAAAAASGSGSGRAGGGGGGSPSLPMRRRHGIVADEVGGGGGAGDDDDRGDEEEEDRDLGGFTPLAASDLTYEDDADGVGDMIDLGIRIGKMRITERIGGLSRPRISEEISASISSQRPPGPNAQQGGGSQLPAFDNMSDGGISDVSLPEYLQPGDQYIVPTSGLVFGQIGDPPPSILQFLPYRDAADRLMTQYFEAVHVVAPCSHMPSLESAYASFWEEINAGFEPQPSRQAIIFAAMLSAMVSMDEHVVISEMGGFPKNDWLSSLKVGTETALSRANFLRTTKTETMQGFIVYMLALCRAEISRAHSVLLGAAVRIAECMGLHRDGEEYGLTPLDTHVRRLMWHQLCFLDIRTCEAQGPRPVIHRADYDTKLPLNCDEAEITHAGTPAPDGSGSRSEPDECADRWTTNTLPLIRFEINEMMRIIWLDRRKLENRKTTLTAVLAKIENFRQRLSAKYDRLLDVRVPAQRYARCVMYLLTYRLHVMALHPYHMNPLAAAAAPAAEGTPTPLPLSLPPRLNQLLVTSSIMVQELAIQLETDAAFAPWAWYAGAYSQHQAALLLAAEVFHRPRAHGYADRIWPCLDWVFGLDRRLPREVRVYNLLAEVQERTAVYLRLRRMRGPRHVVEQQNNSAAAAAAATMPTRQAQQANKQTQSQQQQQQPRPRPRPPSTLLHLKPDPAYIATPPSLPSSGGPAFQPRHLAFPGPMGLATQPGGSAIAPSPPTTTPAMATAMGMSQGNNNGDHSDNGNATSPTPTTNTSYTSFMDTIDWDTVNSLFPTDPQNGGLSVQGFHGLNLGVLDWGG